MLIIPSINTLKLNKNSGLVICHQLKKKRDPWYHVEVIIPFHICWTIQRGMKSLTSRLIRRMVTFGLSVQGKNESEKQTLLHVYQLQAVLWAGWQSQPSAFWDLSTVDQISARRFFKSNRLLRAWVLEQVICFAGVLTSSSKPGVHYPSRIY